MDGVSDSILMCEEAVAVAALFVSRDELHSLDLEPRDFVMAGPRQVYAAALNMAYPSVPLLWNAVPNTVVEWWRWEAQHWMYANPGSLRAHAALVRKDGERRRAIQALANEAGRINREGVTPGWWQEYEVERD